MEVIITKLPRGGGRGGLKGTSKKNLHSFENYSLKHIQKNFQIEEESRTRDKNEYSYESTSKYNAVKKIKPSNNQTRENLITRITKSSRRTSKVIISCVKNPDILQKIVGIENKTRLGQNKLY